MKFVVAVLSILILTFCISTSQVTAVNRARIVGSAKHCIGIVGKAFKLYKDNFFKLIAMSSLVSLPMMFLFTILRIPRGFNHLITMNSLIMAVVAVAVADNLSGEEISILRSYRCVLKRVIPLRVPHD